MPRKHAFTIVEILVVVVIIVLLISILTPAILYAMANAQNATCQTNVSGIGKSFLSFATDHQNTFPGCKEGATEGLTEEWKWSWLGAEVWKGSAVFTADMDNTNPDKPGTLLRYIGGESTAQKIYRCPSLATSPGSAKKNTSNGAFDYSSTLAFSGAKIEGVKYEAQVFAEGDVEEITDPVVSWDRKAGVTAIGKISMPLVLEEAPEMFHNVKDNLDPKRLGPGFETEDMIARNHFSNQANIAVPDGSASTVISSGAFVNGIKAKQLFLPGPRTNKPISAASKYVNPTTGVHFGTWDTRPK